MKTDLPNASMTRRMGAMLYDFLLIFAIWMLTTAAVNNGLNDGESVSGWPYQLLLYSEIFLFYFFFWRINGQSLGMQVWKIKAVNQQGEKISAIQAVNRFLLATISFATLGAGFFWMLFDKERLMMHDRFSKTRIVYLGSKPYASEVVQKIDRRDEKPS